jgi:hypothetical protein
LVSLGTFKGWAGLSPTNTVGLFVVLYLISGIELLVYVIMQVILVVNTLQDRWPLGDIAFGAVLFIVGQVLLYAFSNTICNAIQHYLDGLFFATICNLLAVMMVYKVRPCHRQFCPWFHFTNATIVLGLHHEGGSRVLCRHQTEQLGSKGATPRRRPSRHHLPRYGVFRHGVQQSQPRKKFKLRRFCILR